MWKKDPIRATGLLKRALPQTDQAGTKSDWELSCHAVGLKHKNITAHHHAAGGLWEAEAQLTAKTLNKCTQTAADQQSNLTQVPQSEGLYQAGASAPRKGGTCE
jgi:hypothetical protein